jgi:hypothetical protein
MASYRKTGRVLTAGAALLGALALAWPAQAANVTSTVSYGSKIRAQADSYYANGAVRICDVYPDGYPVMVKYYRKAGDLQTLSNTKGNGTCNETADIQSNPITAFKACVVIDAIAYCDYYWVTTGR